MTSDDWFWILILLTSALISILTTFDWFAGCLFGWAANEWINS